MPNKPTTKVTKAPAAPVKKVTKKPAAKIIGNQDGPNGRNETYYKINGVDVDRPDAVKAVEKNDNNEFSKYTTQKTEGKKYVKGIPDGVKRNNVDPD